MRTRANSRHEKMILSLLADVPEPDDIFAGYWLHESVVAMLVFGSSAKSARRKTRKLLKRLESLGFVECRKWELGVSWRLFDRV